MLTEIAYFTPKTKSGSAQWIDFWNADLFDGESHLSNLYEKDQIRFRKDKTTWSHGFDTKIPNGIIQASFNMPADDYFLGILKLSSYEATITVFIDDEFHSIFRFNGTGTELPITAYLPGGSHEITVLQYYSHWIITVVGKHTWFHSLTCFRI